jgi:hypothetical protein
MLGDHKECKGTWQEHKARFPALMGEWIENRTPRRNIVTAVWS